MDKLLNEIIAVANGAYPDGKVAEYWENGASQAVDTRAGDTLALFVAREIADAVRGETDKEAAYFRAAAAMRSAARELEGVADALSEAANG